MEDLTFLFALPSYIDLLKSTDLPIFIYGMGDGCLKLLAIFRRYGIPCAGIFASDEFVRDKSFEGHKIRSLGEIESAVEEFIVVLAFGAGYKSLIDRIDGIAAKHRLIVPDMPVVGEGLFTKQYLQEHYSQISEVYSLLADEHSRLVYRKLIQYRITGDIAPLKGCETDRAESCRLLSLSGGEVYVDLGAYTGDTVYEYLEYTGGEHSGIIAVEPNARNFRKLSESLLSESVLSENTAGLSNIRLINAAVGAYDGVITVQKGGGRMIRRSDNGVQIRQITLDSLFDGGLCRECREKCGSLCGTLSIPCGKPDSIPGCALCSPSIPGGTPCTPSIPGGSPCSPCGTPCSLITPCDGKPMYIKYDVEGAEMDALKGSENTLRMYKPKLNVALYHRVEDLFALPLYIHSILPKHKLYIRHFPYYPAWDTNLYAVPQD